MYKIVDNLLEDKIVDEMYETMLSTNFPWFFTKKANVNSEQNKTSCHFFHTFYTNDNKVGSINSSYFDMIRPIIDKLNHKVLIRVKANLFLFNAIEHHHGMHKDQEFDHKGAIFYINTNNGYTKLGNGLKIASVKNRLLLFNSFEAHESVNCTDKSVRLNINFNFF